MLRPATPLSVLLLVAFGLLLISVLSTPIIQAIPLGSFNNYNFGVFGYCNGNDCSKIEIGYDTSTINQDGNENDFDLPSSTRSTLSTILVVHPVAALLTLINLVLALVSHLHSPSHSSRYLLAIFLLNILNLVVCLMSFLVDVLLFVPHMAFGSYFVLAATILVALSTLVSCAMRRTIVNRKARKKRIAENAEMSGENFYNRQKEAPTPAMQPTMPVVSGANAVANDKLPTFTTYEKKEERSSEERIPLTARSPSDRSPNQTTMEMRNNEVMYNGPAGPGPRRNGSRDQFGGPINAPPDAYGMRRPSVDSQRSRGRGGMPPGGFRGRGGYGPPRGGGYGPYGPGPGRGGYGPPGRGGYGPPPGRGGYGPPPRGYGGPGMRGGRTPPPPSYTGGGEYGAYGPRQPSPGPPSAPGYQMNNMNNSMPSLPNTNGYAAYNPSRDSELPRAESPPPMPGLPMSASEDNMAAPIANPRTPDPNVRARNSPQPQQPQQYGQFRDSDADIMGMVGLQQGFQQGRSTPVRRHDTYLSDVPSKYSQDDNDYIPPRAAWDQNVGRSSPTHPSAMPPPLRSAGTPPGSSGSQHPQETSYVEDIDPRFAEPTVVAPVHRPTPPPVFDTDQMYDSIPEIPEPRSPAESEHSTFTSISQRGINPRWPGNQPPIGQYLGLPPRRPAPQLDNVLLDNNPDFQLPGARGGPPRRGRGAYPTGF